jgi:large subunit ribosomal protein L18
MPKVNHNLSVSEKRKLRVRSKLHGTSARPRLTVHKSNKYTYLQAVNDEKGVTLVSVSDVKVKKALKKGNELTKTEATIKATEELLEGLKKAKIKAVVFDRGQYKYHGRVKAVAQTLRDGGIEV